jgi:homeobox protein cut-like
MMIKVSEAQDKETELQALKEENTELKRQVAELGDAKKKVDTLEEKVGAHLISGDGLLRAHTSGSLKMDSMIQSRVTQKENELNATYDEKMRNYEDRWVLARLPSERD